MPDAFYERDGDRFVSSELTRGPWDVGSQHAGPPAALIGRAIESLPAPDGTTCRVARVTFEILRPVPIAPLRVEAQIVRPGRRVQMVQASLRAGDDELIRATAWRLRERSLELPADAVAPAQPVPPLEAAEAKPFFPTGAAVGYHTAMEYRFNLGGFLEPGPATVWMRPRVPLVAGEEPSPLQRVLVAADSGNGVSASLDWTRFLFINVDLSVHLSRLPRGEWVCLDAVTRPEADGIGITDTALHDREGPIGRALQTLLVADRTPGVP